MEKEGYTPNKYTPNIWSHHTRPTKFCLCVDDFGVKCYSKSDADHLIQSLNKYYDVTVDCTGSQYCGLDIKWDYDNEHVDISMQNYVSNALAKYNFKPTQKQYAPHEYATPAYGQRQQYTKLDNTTSPLNKYETTKIQAIVGTFLYYA
mmetsp:Transcript_1688/g.2422  ORF Transcript_1688/g.2422 Transcript_1688/m.2422 type:complete len:148 (-) Transcript_1688:616-1059(-)